MIYIESDGKAMLKTFREIIDQILNQNKKCTIPLDIQYLAIMRLVYLKKSLMTSAEYNNRMHKYTFANPDITWKPDIQPEQLNQLIDMDISLFNSVGDEYLQKEQRDNTGSFYTPSGIVNFMVYDILKSYLVNSGGFESELVEKVINPSKSAIRPEEKKISIDILEAVLKCRVIDIASGSGVFLIHYIRFIKKIMTLYYPEYVINKRMIELIENNVFATDIRECPLEMLVITLMDEVELKDATSDCFYPHIYCCNSVYGEELLNNKGIQGVMNTGGFELVLGNPPYIGEKGNKAMFEKLRSTSFGERCYEGKMDLFYFFIYRGYDLLSDNGFLSFITTNYFVTADGARKLREFLSDNTTFTTVVNFNNQRVFSSMKGHNMIFTFAKNKREELDLNIKYYHQQQPLSKYNFEDLLNEGSSKLFNSYYLEGQSEIYDQSKNINLFPNKNHYDVIRSISEIASVNLGNLVSINQGIVSGADKVSKQMYEKKLSLKNIDAFKLNLGDGIFVLNSGEVAALDEAYETVLKPFYKNSDIRSYAVNHETDRSILYIEDHVSSELIPQISERLTPFKEVLSERREVKNGKRSWYALQWPRKKTIFEKDKIIVPQRSAKNRFAWTDKPWYASADVYYITTEDNQVDLKVLLGYLNSKLVYYWLYHRGKKKGKDLELYATPLKSIPIPMVVYMQQHSALIDMVDEIMINLEVEEIESVERLKKNIDNFIYEILELDDHSILEIEMFYKSMHGC